MCKNKVVVASLIAAVAASADPAQCAEGGFYIGANVGAKINQFKIRDDDDGKAKWDSVSKGKPIAELLVGYDHCFGRIVVGADAILGTMFGKISPKDLDPDCEDNSGGLKNPFSFAFMPRVGYRPLPQLELYATGGVKVASWKLNYKDKDEKARTSKKNTAGAAVGAGVMYGFTPHFYGKFEYNCDFRRNYKFAVQGASVPVKIHAHVIKIGAVYKF